MCKSLEDTGDISAFSKNRTICVQVPFKTCVEKFVGLLSDDSIASLSKIIMEACDLYKESHRGFDSTPIAIWLNNLPYKVFQVKEKV